MPLRIPKAPDDCLVRFMVDVAVLFTVVLEAGVEAELGGGALRFGCLMIWKDDGWR